MVLTIRLGKSADIDAAVSIYSRSSLAYHRGDWPAQAMRLEHLRLHLLDPATWFLLAYDGPILVSMSSIQPLRSDNGAGPIVPGNSFLSYLYVDPERWGEGIGGAILDAVLSEARSRRSERIQLLTYEDNERAHRLYHSRGFWPTGRTAGQQSEWMRDL
jgi:GNAT superfamily N-acetyltransferase